MTPGSIVHVAGLDVQVGRRLRQRCAWCGALLVDEQLDRVAALAGQNPRPPTWEPGVLVAVDGAASSVLPHDEGAQLPDQACARLDADVTA